MADNKKKTYYDPSEDAVYTAATEKLASHNATKPSYAGTYEQQLKDTYERIANREKFSYDLNGDALYKQYKDQYILGGKQAMMDTMGQAAALTGGYGSSYGVTAGNQAYQGHLQQLNDRVPELYQLALDRYNQEGQDLHNQYTLLGNMRDSEYGQYMDRLGVWQTDRDYLTGERDTAYGQGYQAWSDIKSDESAYYDRLVTLITSTGYTPTADELSRAGMTSAEAGAYKNVYIKNNTPTSSGGGSRKSSGSSGSSGGTGGGVAVKADSREVLYDLKQMAQDGESKENILLWLKDMYDNEMIGPDDYKEFVDMTNKNVKK